MKINFKIFWEAGGDTPKITIQTFANTNFDFWYKSWLKFCTRKKLTKKSWYKFYSTFVPGFKSSTKKFEEKNRSLLDRSLFCGLCGQKLAVTGSGSGLGYCIFASRWDFLTLEGAWQYPILCHDSKACSELCGMLCVGYELSNIIQRRNI